MILPSGTVTFVFTDIEGSTRLLKQLGDTEYGTLLAVHRRLVRDIFAAHDGQEIDTQGDAFFYSFLRARQAVAGAIEVQRAHTKASWPAGSTVRVRLGLHTGEPAVGDEGYTGLDVVRASRIAALGAGGRVLLSDTTRAIVAGDLPDGVELRAIGERQLKDIDRPEPIFELRIAEVEASTSAPSDAAPREEPESAPETGLAAGQSEPGEGVPLHDFDPMRPGTPGGAALREFIDHARQRLESRVLARLETTLAGLGSEAPPPGPRPPEGRPPRSKRGSGSVTQEIARLNELRKDGALTDEQYQRAVDRLLEGEGS